MSQLLCHVWFLSAPRYTMWSGLTIFICMCIYTVNSQCTQHTTIRHRIKHVFWSVKLRNDYPVRLHANTTIHMNMECWFYLLCDRAWACTHTIHTHLVYINIESIGIRILLVDFANMASLFTFLDSHTWNLRCCRLTSPLPLTSQLVFHVCCYAYSNIDILHLTPPLAPSLFLSLSLFSVHL